MTSHLFFLQKIGILCQPLLLWMLYFVHFPAFNIIIRIFSPSCCLSVRAVMHELAFGLEPKLIFPSPCPSCYQQPAGCIHTGVSGVHIPVLPLTFLFVPTFATGLLSFEKQPVCVYIHIYVRVCTRGFLMFCFWMCRMRQQREREGRTVREIERGGTDRERERGLCIGRMHVKNTLVQ